MFGKRKNQPAVADPAASLEELETDPETGLMAAARFEDVIQKEIARGLRYGSTSALAIFEIGVAERATSGPIPSPAKFAANALRKAARSSDIVARVSPQTFAVLLVEARGEGANQFAERVRTSIGSNPYARRPDGTGLFARAWAGVAQWEPAFESVGAYVGAAQKSLSATYRGYEAAQDWFRGEGLNKPFVA